VSRAVGDVSAERRRLQRTGERSPRSSSAPHVRGQVSQALGLPFGLVFSSWSVGGLVATVALPRLLRTATPSAITLWALRVSAVIGLAAAARHLLSRVNTAGRMLAWGIGGTFGAASAGALASMTGIRPALIAVTSLTFVGAAIAWTSPLRGGFVGSVLDTAPVPV
jgi:hypothetical protein